MVKNVGFGSGVKDFRFSIWVVTFRVPGPGFRT
jgi:hypothetical protein